MSIKTAILFSFLVSTSAWCVVPPSTVWQILPEATAGNVNGCAFDSGSGDGSSVDYSQQAAAAVLRTDLVIGANGNTLTSITPFTADERGNAIHITAGTGFNITGVNSWHIITDVTAGVATLYDSAGTPASSGGTGRTGGGCSMNSILDLDLFQNRNSSNTFWWHGNATMGESINLGSTGTTLSPVNHYGWNVTRGDNPDMSTAPAINYAAGTFTFGNYENFSNLNITGSSAGGFTLAVGNVLKNLKVANTSTLPRPAMSPAAQSKILQCDFSSPNGPALTLAQSNLLIDRCFIHDSSNGVQGGGTDFNTVTRNIFAVINSTAYSLGSGAIGSRIEDNTFFGTATVATGRGIGIFMRDGTSGDNYIARNNIIGFSTGFYAQDTVLSNVADYNNYYGNVLNMSTAAPTGLNDTFVNPNFVDWIHYNFTPQNTALNKTYGYSNTSSSTTLTIGAIQIPSSSGGGTRGTVYIK